jgi:hypothetical protein
MLDYILVIYLNLEPQYIGTFQDCHTAHEFVIDRYPEFDSGCLHRNYINLPLDLEEKYYIISPQGKIVKWENK